MVAILLEGFDKYGPVNSNGTNVAALMAGEWTSVTGIGSILPPLSATGQAFSAQTGTLVKSLPTLGRIIGGCRFNLTLSGSNAYFQFNDAGTNQFGIQITTGGVINLRNGAAISGTILGSGATPISSGTTHYLEWDVTLGNASPYNVYLDGVSIISGTGDTTATANNSINGLTINFAGTNLFIVDDLYLFDATGTVNNAPLLTSPRIETQLPNADSAVQFAVGPSVLGGTVARVATLPSSAANYFVVRPYTPSRNCTLNAISVGIGTSNASINFRPIIYSDSAGVPGTLMSAGSTVVGVSAPSVTMPLTTPQSLIAGTQYWLGFMCDVVVTSVLALYDNSAGAVRTGTSTFGSGAPGTPPTNSAGASNTNFVLWGNITLVAPVNYYETNQQPPPGALSYVYSSTPAQEDLYGFPALSTPGATIHSVAMKGFSQKSDAGTRTMSLRSKSGGIDSGGSLTGQALGTSMQWYGSFFPTDPATSAPWPVAALNLATGGVRVDS